MDVPKSNLPKHRNGGFGLNVNLLKIDMLVCVYPVDTGLRNPTVVRELRLLKLVQGMRDSEQFIPEIRLSVIAAPRPLRIRKANAIMLPLDEIEIPPKNG